LLSIQHGKISAINKWGFMSFAFLSRLYPSSEAPKYTDNETEYAAAFPHWPRALNYPPAAIFPTHALMKLAKSSATSTNPHPESWGKFKEFVQIHQSAGHETVELVSREILETAKTHLGIVHWKLYYAIEVLQGSSLLTGCGAALMAFGALGVYRTQPELIDLEQPPKRNWTRILSYGAMITGIAMVALASYRLNSAASTLLQNFDLASTGN
jgi:hypothetical protein